MGAIALVVDHGMAVVDLEKAFTPKWQEILGGDAPIEVGMVDVRKHRLAGAAALEKDVVDVVLHDIEHVAAAVGFEAFPGICHVDVDGPGEIPVRQFLAGDEEELPGLFEKRSELCEWFKSDLVGSETRTFLDPGAVAFLVSIEGFSSASTRAQSEPILSLQRNVVIREGEKVVAVVAVPFGDHLGIIVAVAPERMSVEVAFPPRGARRFAGEGAFGERSCDGSQE
jgi:hypothetical protein